MNAELDSYKIALKDLENKEKINWSLLGNNLKLQYLFTDSFVELFDDKPIWNCLIWSDKVSDECILKHLDKFSENDINEKNVSICLYYFI